MFDRVTDMKSPLEGATPQRSRPFRTCPLHLSSVVPHAPLEQRLKLFSFLEGLQEGDWLIISKPKRLRLLALLFVGTESTF